MPALERSQFSRSGTQSSIYCRSSSTLSKNASEKNKSDCEKNTKPSNVFYVWYAELCRRQNSNPVSAIRPSHMKNEKVLDFVADRIKVEDWTPIINALRKDTSLHVISIHSRIEVSKFESDADSEEKVRKIKRHFGPICTKYILRALMKSLTVSLRSTQVLSYLELDGLYIKDDYLDLVLQAISANKTLKYLSFKSCPIGDEGCFYVCEAMHSLPNIEVLNMSACDLGSTGAEHLSKLIKYQQINRYCESWHSSLRYEDPVVSNMAGLKRITINNNPRIGDDGLYHILGELVDDLWIKALDMQRCSVTEGMAEKILDVVQYSRSLEVLDLRHNSLAPLTVERILELLKDKQSFDADSEYKWCLTSTTLNHSLYESYTSTVNTRTLTGKTVKSSRSVSKRPTTTHFSSATNSRKENKEMINNMVKPDNTSLIKAKEQLLQMYGRLREEMQKRLETEKKCVELQKQVDELLNLQKHQMIVKEFSNMKEYIHKFISFVKQNDNSNEHAPIISDLQNALEEVKHLAKPYERAEQSFGIQSVNKMLPQELKPLVTIAEGDDSSTKCQELFKNFLGKSIEDDSMDDLSAYVTNDEKDLTDYNKDESSYTDMCESSRSTDSESVETYKRLLEELSQEEDTKNSSVGNLSDFSALSDETPKDAVKMVIKIPQVNIS